MNTETDWVDEEPTKKAKPKTMKKKTAAKKTNVKKLAKTAKPAKTAKAEVIKKITLNFKILPKEAKAIRLKANELTNGNVTQMVRLAVLAWKPAKNTLEDIRKTTRV